MNTYRSAVTGLIGMILFGWGGRPAMGQVMYADFENHGLGIIRASSNWDRSSMNDKAVVVDTLPNTGQKSLELYSNAYSEAHAIVHNFVFSNSPAVSPIIHASVLIYADSADEELKWALGDGYTNINLQVWTASTYPHTIHLGNSDTGYGLVTGRYARMTLYFDTEENRASLDYDGEMILPWWPCNNTLSNRVNLMHFMRGNHPPSGRVVLDDVTLDSAAADTWAWWRFEEGSGESTRDHLGHFPMQAITNRYGAHWLTNDVQWCYSGSEDIQDRYGLDAYGLDVVHPMTNSPMTTNWTLEAVVRNEPGFWNGTSILHWFGHGDGVAYQGSKIDLVLGENFWFYLNLRDAEEPDSWDSDYYSSHVAVPTDGAWHFLAAVKSNQTLSLYMDAQLLTNYTMGTVSDGGYQFSTNTDLFIGRAENTNETAHTNNSLSELRYTCRALTPAEFISPDSADVVGIEHLGTGNLQLVTIRCNPPLTYYLEGSGSLLTPSWTSRLSFQAADIQTSVSVSGLGNPYFYRAYRLIDRHEM